MGTNRIDCTVNLWQQRAKECRAKRAFAISKNLILDSVSFQDVNKSAEGLDFWAECQVQTCVGAGPKARAKGKAKPKPDAAAPSLVTLEKQLKQLIGSEIGVLSEFTKLDAKVKEAPDDYAWAEKVMDEARKHKTELEGMGSAFMDRFRAAALSPSQMKELRKSVGEGYLPALIHATEKLGPGVQGITDVINKAV